LATSEKPAQQGRDGELSSATLPAVQSPAFAKHWLAVDEGGAALMTAAFGAPARQAPRRFAPVPASPGRATTQPAPRLRQIAPHPTRMRATVILLLLALTILLVEPAARLFRRALMAGAETGSTRAISVPRQAQAFVIDARHVAAPAAGA